MARRTARGDHRGIAQGGAAFQVDGDDILGLVVIQGRQNALEQIAWRRGFPRRGARGFLGGWLFGFLGRDLLGGFGGGFLGGGFLAGGLLGSFTCQG